MIIFVYMYKYQIYDIILLPKNAKIIFSQKYTLKGDISDISEKIIFILENVAFLLN